MKNKIKLGIIGKNFGYNVIYKSFIKNNDYKIVGFSFKSKKFDKIKLPKKIKVYFNWKKLILNKNINAIAIAVPPTLHKNIIEFGIKHNKHIFCEKPFSCSKKEANYVCQLIDKKKNISHMVNYEFVEIDAFRFFKNRILKRKLKINKIDLDWFVNVRRKSKNSWKEDYATGGGIMFNFVCHAIYYLEFLFGKIISTKSKIYLGKNLDIEILDQKRDSLDPNMTLANALTGGGDNIEINGIIRHVIGYMKSFLFSPEQARTSVNVLSGGERARIMIARALAKPSNFLILDEILTCVE